MLALGRTARWKGLGTLLDAAELAVGRGADLQLEVRGPSLSGDERAHRAELERRVAGNERLRARVQILQAVPRAEIPSLIAAVDLIVSPNEPRSGATLDKAVFEAAACARPVCPPIRGSPRCSATPRCLICAPRDPHALADAIGRRSQAPSPSTRR